MEGKRLKKRTLELEDEWGKDELARPGDVYVRVNVSGRRKV